LISYIIWAYSGLNGYGLGLSPNTVDIVFDIMGL